MTAPQIPAGERQNLIAKRNALIEKQQQSVGEIVTPLVEEGVKSGKFNNYVTTNIYDIKVPDIVKIRQDASKLVFSGNERIDNALREKYIDEVKGAVDFSIKVPQEELDARAENKFKEKYGKTPQEFIQGDYEGKIGEKIAPITKEFEAKRNALELVFKEQATKEYRQLATPVETQLGQFDQEYKAKIDELQSLAANDPSNYEKYSKEADFAYQTLKSKTEKATAELLEINNQVNMKYNQEFQNQQRRLAAEVDKKFKEVQDKFSYNTDPKILNDLKNIYSQSANEIYSEANKAIDVVQKGKVGVGVLDPYTQRFVTSTLSSLGGTLKSWSAAVGASPELGEKMESYFGVDVSPMKSFRDMTIDNVVESGGQLTGTMLPTILASIGVGAATRNANLTVRTFTTGMAAFMADSVDQTSRSYMETMARTGSTEQAKNAAEETFASQMAFMPTYAVGALPFVKGFAKIKNTPTRILVGATTELAEETIQEYGQNLAQESIEKTGEAKNLLQFATPESFTETFVNLPLVAVIGGVGAIQSDTKPRIPAYKPEAPLAYIPNLVANGGTTQAKVAISSLYQNGIIDKQQFDDMAAQIELAESNKENGLEYSSLANQAQFLRERINSAQDEVEKSVLKEKLNDTETAMKAVLRGEPSLTTKTQVNSNGQTIEVYTPLTKEQIKEKENGQTKQTQEGTVRNTEEKQTVTTQTEEVPTTEDVQSYNQAVAPGIYTETVELPEVTVKAGKRLFNEPNPETKVIATEYKQAKGIDVPEGAPITKIDENKSKSIADAYDAMENNPNDPQVKAAYEAMAQETKDQFDAITKAGVKFEIYEGQGEPYKNSEEMIKDVRDNKHLFVLSTEKDFGQNPITDEQRNDNPLLRDSGFTDVNGKKLLVNDVFRGVHDFFGHTERGNSFGAVGEENAWDVHARMFTPLARRAMTTETRGQNSWVNFGKQMRNPDGSIKKKGDEGYMSATERPFAEQKIGLLPEEFSNIEDNYTDKSPKFTVTADAPVDLPNVTVSSPIHKKVIADVNQAAKTLASSGVKFKIYDNAESFASESGQDKSTQGVFVDEDGTVSINLAAIKNSKDWNIAWHESSHPVMNIIRNTNRSLYDQMANGLAQLAKTNNNAKAIVNWSKNNYEGKETQVDEAMIESIALMADGTIDFDSVPTGFKQAVIDFVNEIAKYLGLDPLLSDTDKATFIKKAKEISNALKTGTDISEVVGKENVTEFKNNIGDDASGAQQKAVTVAKGTESMNKFGLNEGRNTTRKIGEALETRTREKYGIIGRDDRSEEALKKISSWMAEEVKFFVNEFGENSGKGWYGEKFQKGIDAMAKIFPELSNDQNARDLFTMLVAITSDGTEVMQNFKQASMAYQYYKDNGKMPETAKSQRAASYVTNFANIQRLLDENNGDVAEVKKKLLEVTSIAELNKKRRLDGIEDLKTSWPASFEVPLAAGVFGPKLGMFYANLSGMENYPTLDRWWSRTFNRYRGTLIPQVTKGFNKKGEALGIDAYRQVAGLENASEDEMLSAIARDHDSYEDKGFKNGTVAEKKANTLYKKLFIELNDFPFGRNDRKFMYDAFIDTKKKLKSAGVDVTIADIQAILWYFEKNLYKKLGVTKPIQGISYEDAANTTFEKWNKAGKSFDYSIDKSEEGETIEDIDETGDMAVDTESAPVKGVASPVQQKVGKVELPATTQKQMTEDDKGNYLFYHYSDKNIKKIDPNKFGSNTRATGRDERPGVGISMYYTRPDVKEQNVPSQYGYVVRVPKGKVYPFNQDPLNLIEPARRMFEKQYPGQAFDPNKQVAWVSKAAAGRGYPMTVAEWNIGRKKLLRAQTTEALKPEVYSKLKPGTLNQVETNPALAKFKPNAKRAQAKIGGGLSVEDLKDFNSLPNVNLAEGNNYVPLSRFGINDLTGENVKTVAEKLTEVEGPYQPIFKAISKMPKANKVEMYNLGQTANIFNQSGGMVAGLYSRPRTFLDKPVIGIATDIYANQYAATAHEMMRWVTLDSINKNKGTTEYKALEDIYKFLKAKHSDIVGEKASGAYYGLQNFNEFMAELLTNKDFRDNMAGIMAKDKEEFRDTVYGYNKSTSGDIITTLINYVQKVIRDLMDTWGKGVDFNKSMIDNATDLAVKAFFKDQVGGAQLRKGGANIDTDTRKSVANMLGKLSDEDVAQIIMDEKGLTKDEAMDLIEDVKYDPALNPSVEDIVGDLEEGQKARGLSKTFPDRGVDTIAKINEDARNYRLNSDPPKDLGIDEASARLLYLKNPDLNIEKRIKKAAKVIKSQKLGGFGNKLVGLVNVPIEFVPTELLDEYIDAISFLSDLSRYTKDKTTGAVKILSDPAFKDKVEQLSNIAIAANARMGIYNSVAQTIQDEMDRGRKLSDILAELVLDGAITNEEAEYFKSRPLKKVKPIRQLVPSVIKNESKITLDTSGLSERQVEVVKLLKGITEEDIKMLGEKALFLPEMVKMINAGLISYPAIRLSREIQQNRTAKAMVESVSNPLTNVVAEVRTLFHKLYGKNKKARTEMRAKSAKYGRNVDASLGLKGKAISDALYGVARASAQIGDKVAPIEAEVNAVLESISSKQSVKQKADIRTAMFSAQRQKDLNPNDPTVDSVKDFVKAMNRTKQNITKVTDALGEDYYNFVMETYEKYKDSNGELDATKLYKDLSEKERKLIVLQRANATKNQKFAEDAANENGRMFIPSNAYFHVPVLTSTINNYEKDMQNVAELINNEGFNRISTNAGAIKARTKGTPVPIFSTHRSIVDGAQEVFRDYYLYRPLINERGAFNKAKKMLENNVDGDIVMRAIDLVVQQQRNMLLSSNPLQENIPAVWKYLGRTAVGSMLATGKKLVSELIPNVLALSIRSVAQGRVPLKYFAKTMANTQQFNRAIQNVAPSEIDRLLHGDVVAGQAADVDLGAPNQYTPFKREASQKVTDWMNKYLRNWWMLENTKAKKLRGLSPAGLEKLAIQSADKMLAIDLFRYKFENEFKKQTGENLDWDKLAKNDKEYFEKYSEEIAKAAKEGDREVETLQSSTNPANKSFNEVKASKSGMLNASQFFMLPFQISDYQNLRAAISEGGFRGSMETALPIFARQMVYTWLGEQFVKLAVANMFGDDDDLDEVMDHLTDGDNISKAALVGVISLFVLRGMNSWKRAGVVAAVEWANYLYGEGITRQEGEEYNKYESLFYNNVPVGWEATRSDMFDWAKASSSLIVPQLSPIINSTEYIYKVGAKDPDNFLKQYNMFDDDELDDKQRYYFTKGLLGLGAASGVVQKDWENVITWEENKDKILKEEGGGGAQPSATKMTPQEREKKREERAAKREAMIEAREKRSN